VNGHAIYLADVAGTPTYFLCGALNVDRPDLFVGFIDTPAVLPGSTIIATGRGSRVVPFVQGAVPLVPNQEVWLSTTPGEVTQTPPAGPARAILRLGTATSTTEMVLTTDFRQAIP
jgi:hypothetical protein